MLIIKFICVSFNNTLESKKFVESLDAQKGRGTEFSVECIIVDNSTHEEEAAECERLSSHYSWVAYRRAPHNLGYFGGLNYGVSMARPAGASYVVICNNDLQFENNFCITLLGKKYADKILLVCPDVVTADGFHQNPHILRRISWFRRFQFDLYFSHYYASRLMLLILRAVRPVKPSPQQPQSGCVVHMGVGACYVLTAEFFRRFKKLNYPFFLYGEEAYIADQIHTGGGILWYDPDLCVHHTESATLSRVPSRTAYEFARKGYSDYRRLL